MGNIPGSSAINYIEFANGKTVGISSAALYFTALNTMSRQGAFIAVGSNPFNQAPFNPFVPSSFAS
jgi:hypothetical protein